MEELRSKKNDLFQKLVNCQAKINLAKKILARHEEKWKVLHKEYQQVDRTLAMTDGRYREVKPRIRIGKTTSFEGSLNKMEKGDINLLIKKLENMLLGGE